MGHMVYIFMPYLLRMDGGTVWLVRVSMSGIDLLGVGLDPDPHCSL